MIPIQTEALLFSLFFFLFFCQNKQNNNYYFISFSFSYIFFSHTQIYYDQMHAKLRPKNKEKCYMYLNFYK
jgi:hypothetical protein